MNLEVPHLRAWPVQMLMPCSVGYTMVEGNEVKKYVCEKRTCDGKTGADLKTLQP